MFAPLRLDVYDVNMEGNSSLPLSPNGPWGKLLPWRFHEQRQLERWDLLIYL
jgi:hypothetical protein